MREVPRRLAVLFGVATLGVLVVVGIGVGEVLGAVGVVAYAALLLLGLAAVVTRARRRAPAPLHHCTCCDGDHTAPVKVI